MPLYIKTHKPNSKAAIRVQSNLETIKLKLKTLTKDGKTRKERIVDRLFTKNVKTQLILNFYVAALPMLKDYVCTFQCQEPMIHKLNDWQDETTKKYLASFIKAEKLTNLTPMQLKAFDVGSIENNLPLKDMFTGKKTSNLLKKYQHPNDFLLAVSRAYRFSARYLLHKFPLTNKLIIRQSALDPVAPCHSIVAKSLKFLSE